MTKIGQLSVGKIGFDVGFDHDIMRKYHGNFDLYANVDTSDNSDYVKCLEALKKQVEWDGWEERYLIEILKKHFA